MNIRRSSLAKINPVRLWRGRRERRKQDKYSSEVKKEAYEMVGFMREVLHDVGIGELIKYVKKEFRDPTTVALEKLWHHEKVRPRIETWIVGEMLKGVNHKGFELSDILKLLKGAYPEARVMETMDSIAENKRRTGKKLAKRAISIFGGINRRLLLMENIITNLEKQYTLLHLTPKNAEKLPNVDVNVAAMNVIDAFGSLVTENLYRCGTVLGELKKSREEKR